MRTPGSRDMLLMILSVVLSPLKNKS